MHDPRTARGELLARCSRASPVRDAALSLELAAPLTPEDMAVQAMEDASPTKWHLAHVTWFFETFVLRILAGYRVFDEHLQLLLQLLL